MSNLINPTEELIMSDIIYHTPAFEESKAYTTQNSLNEAQINGSSQCSSEIGHIARAEPEITSFDADDRKSAQDNPELWSSGIPFNADPTLVERIRMMIQRYENADEQGTLQLDGRISWWSDEKLEQGYTDDIHSWEQVQSSILSVLILNGYTKSQIKALKCLHISYDFDDRYDEVVSRLAAKPGRDRAIRLYHLVEQSTIFSPLDKFTLLAVLADNIRHNRFDPDDVLQTGDEHWDLWITERQLAERVAGHPRPGDVYHSLLRLQSRGLLELSLSEFHEPQILEIKIPLAKYKTLVLTSLNYKVLDSTDRSNDSSLDSLKETKLGDVKISELYLADRQTRLVQSMKQAMKSTRKRSKSNHVREKLLVEMQLSLDVPQTIQQLADKTGMHRDTISKLLVEMKTDGTAVPTRHKRQKWLLSETSELAARIRHIQTLEAKSAVRVNKIKKQVQSEANVNVSDHERQDELVYPDQFESFVVRDDFNPVLEEACDNLFEVQAELKQADLSDHQRVELLEVQQYWQKIINRERSK
jgi:biotin operon repressor